MQFLRKLEHIVVKDNNRRQPYLSSSFQSGQTRLLSLLGAQDSSNVLVGFYPEELSMVDSAPFISNH